MGGSFLTIQFHSFFLVAKNQSALYPDNIEFPAFKGQSAEQLPNIQIKIPDEKSIPVNFRDKDSLKQHKPL